MALPSQHAFLDSQDGTVVFHGSSAIVSESRVFADAILLTVDNGVFVIWAIFVSL
jgi:hypothetical protein